MLPFLGHRSVWWLCLLRFLRLMNMLWVDPQPPRGKSSWECWVLWFHALFQFAKCALFAPSWTIRDWWLREKMLAKSWLLGEVTAQTLSKHIPEGLLQHLDGIVLLSTGTSERLLRKGTEEVYFGAQAFWNWHVVFSKYTFPLNFLKATSTHGFLIFWYQNKSVRFPTSFLKHLCCFNFTT